MANYTFVKRALHHLFGLLCKCWVASFALSSYIFLSYIFPCFHYTPPPLIHHMRMRCVLWLRSACIGRAPPLRHGEHGGSVQDLDRELAAWLREPQDRASAGIAWARWRHERLRLPAQGYDEGAHTIF